MSRHSSPMTPIAVVGMGALLPDAPDIKAFWKNVLTGRDSMTDVPKSHWLIEDYYDANPAAPDKTYGRRGGFVPTVLFDPMAFGIPPNIVQATDTAQLLALIVAKQVLDDAARGDFASMNTERMSVILGATGAQKLMVEMGARLQRPVWAHALRELGYAEEEVEAACTRIESQYVPFQESTFPGLLGNVIAGRIANRFNLGGTNCVLDAACASSLAAVAMAIQELELGHSDLVIAGGVDTMNDISMFMCFSKTPALSPTGDCRPFSSEADGTMLGEGLAMFALKRLADAERDGDPIYAVIRGLGSASDGRGLSVYAPRPDGQAKALRRAYESAGYGPETVELMEAHGTGTKAGDLAEFTALARVFGESGRVDRQWCALGSVKSQIGHTKSAAGAAGMAKAVLALQHKVLPPSIKIAKPNAQLEVEKTAFYLSSEARPWIRDEAHPRRASVSAFGFGGSNFHVTLEEYVGASARPLRTWTSPTELILLGAATSRELGELCRETSRAVTDDERLNTRARRSQSGFDVSQPCRVAVTATDPADLRRKLDQAAQRLEQHPSEAFSSPTGLHIGMQRREGSLAYLFPGQGSQYVGMGADLAKASDAARALWDIAASTPLATDARLPAVVFPPPAFSAEELEIQTNRLTATEWAQPAIGTTSLALLAVLRELGLAPERVGGHSFGELTALQSAGVFEVPTFLRAARRRGELMRDASSTPGAMTAVTRPVAEVVAILEEAGIEISIANDNGPRQVVLSGTVGAIELAEKALKTRGIATRRLSVATAFHSPVVAAARDPFLAFLSPLPLAAPSLPVYSNVDAQAHASDPETIRTRLADQIVSRVRFVEMIESMYGAGVRTFVEVGPGNVLSNLVEQILGSRPATIVHLDRKGQHGLTALWNGLGRLAAAGHALDFGSFWQPWALEAERPEAPPKFAIPLNGANHGRPYPSNKHAGAITPRARPVIAMSPATVDAPTLQKAGPEVAPAPLVERPPAVAQTAPLVRSAAPDEAAVGSLGEAHAAFQRALSDGHSSYLRAMEASFASLCAATTGRFETSAPVTAPLPAPVPVAIPPVPAAQAKAAVAPAAAEPLRVVSRPPAPTAPAAVEVTSLLIEVVADKTGYPLEMLNLSMSLEGDLGVDSIKRVEILSALRQRVPGLPTLQPGDIASLRTLAQIAEYLRSVLGPVAAPPVATKPVAKLPAPVAASVNLSEAVLGVVADKTGYPREMLSPSMSLEGDLGIDSIKRVEILSALRQQLPQLPALQPSELASLRTLGQIIDHLQQGVGGAGSAAPTVVSSVPVIATPVIDLAAALTAVVAEKTGYPIEMLNPSMSLEGDLGIDSIKRVEILSALRQKVPQLPALQPSDLASLRTLGQIVGHLQKGQKASAPAPVAARSAPVASAPIADLASVLMAVVAEKTGYPIEMLAPSMSLEGDLGIDSIKRVEILSALRQKLPHLPPLQPASMAALRTLGQIVEHLQGASTLSASPPEVPKRIVESRAKEGKAVLARSVVVEVGAAASGHSVFAGQSPRRVVVTEDGTGVAAEVVAELGRAGIAAECVSVVPADAEAVIFLGGLRAIQVAADAFAVAREAFVAARTVASRFTSAEGVFVTVQDTGGDFGLAGLAGDRAWLAGLSALAKTAAQEWPSASVKAIDVQRDGRSNEAVAAAIVNELLHGGLEREVGLHSDGARTTLAAIPSVAAVGAFELRKGAVVVVSGGARGVTVATLEALLRRAPLRIAILGRTAIDDEPGCVRGIEGDANLKKALLGDARLRGETLAPAELGRIAERVLATREARAGIAALERLGGEVRYLPVDVRDEKAVATALAAVRSEWGPIAGLIHAAGVLADRTLAEKTDEQFDRVFDTKVKGLRALLEATKDDPLEILCVFSSVAARAGNVGQSDYALGNEILNRVAAAERVRRGGKTLVRSLGWGPWDGGMVTPALRTHFESRGIALIPRQAGAEALVDELRTGPEGDVEVLLGATLEAEGSRDADALEKRFVVTPSSHPFLESHRVRGRVVLPAVIALEWFARTARSLFPGLQVVSCDDVRVLKGIVLRQWDEAGETFTVHCRSIERSHATTSLVFELLGEGGVRHYTGRVQLAAKFLPGAEAKRPAVPDETPHAPAGAVEAYSNVLFHGPQFQSISALGQSSEAGLAATLVGAMTLGWENDASVTDPALLDGGLQLAILWANDRLGRQTLPTRIGALKIFRSGFIDGPVQTLLRVDASDEFRTSSTVAWIDAAGKLIAVMEGLEMHVLSGAAARLSDAA